MRININIDPDVLATVQSLHEFQQRWHQAIYEKWPSDGFTYTFGVDAEAEEKWQAAKRRQVDRFIQWLAKQDSNGA